MTRKQPSKGDRALELHEKGIAPVLIAERLGVSPARVSQMLMEARRRREKGAAE